jgi:hypothetical protein
VRNAWGGRLIVRVGRDNVATAIGTGPIRVPTRRPRWQPSSRGRRSRAPDEDEFTQETYGPKLAAELRRQFSYDILGIVGEDRKNLADRIWAGELRVSLDEFRILLKTPDGKAAYGITVWPNDGESINEVSQLVRMTESGQVMDIAEYGADHPRNAEEVAPF